MKRSTLLGAIILLFSFFTVAQAQIYGISAIGENPNADLIDGYGATALEYDIAAYYIGYTESYMYEENTIMDAGAAYDHNDPSQAWYIADVYTQTSSRQYGANYYVITDHYVGSYFYVPGFGYYDPYGFQYYGGEYGSDETWLICNVCSGYYSFELIYLGSTGVGIAQPALTVEFQRLDGSAFPTPLKVGISSLQKNRQLSLRATVSRPSVAARINIEGSGRLSVDNVQHLGNGTIVFTVVGINRSDFIGDQYIKASYPPLGFSHLRGVSVVIPWNVALPHDTTGGGVVIANEGLNVNTSPADPEIPASQYKLVTTYLRHLTIRVVDQFGEGIGDPDLYLGSPIYEFTNDYGWSSINRTLNSNSTYMDPVGAAAYYEPAEVISANDTARLVEWISEPRVPLLEGAVPQNYPVRLDDRFELNTGIFNRLVRWRPPNIIEIIW